MRALEIPAGVRRVTAAHRRREGSTHFGESVTASRLHARVHAVRWGTRFSDSEDSRGARCRVLRRHKRPGLRWGHRPAARTTHDVARGWFPFGVTSAWYSRPRHRRARVGYQVEGRPACAHTVVCRRTGGTAPRSRWGRSTGIKRRSRCAGSPRIATDEHAASPGTPTALWVHRSTGSPAM